LVINPVEPVKPVNVRIPSRVALLANVRVLLKIATPILRQSSRKQKHHRDDQPLLPLQFAPDWFPPNRGEKNAAVPVRLTSALETVANVNAPLPMGQTLATSGSRLLARLH